MSSYDLRPVVEVPGAAERAVAGWGPIVTRLVEARARRQVSRVIIVVECYPGVMVGEILGELKRRLEPTATLAVSEIFRSSPEVKAFSEPWLGTDPVFGRLNDLEIPDYFDPVKLAKARAAISTWSKGLYLVVGCGAQLLVRNYIASSEQILIYCDLARWEAQLRFRRGGSNLGLENGDESAAAKYKRAFFIDWRSADRLKAELLPQWDFVLDTNDQSTPKMATGDAVRGALQHCMTRPFRVVPFFDPAPWGGQWMKHNLGLDPSRPNYGWCFDCVPEENSLLLGFGSIQLEIPAINLVLAHAPELLGQSNVERFGASFPIRFDLLDTMGGGNLSLQVHPLTKYIQEHFGMSFTQDESYYILAAEPGAKVVLGLKTGVDRAAMVSALRSAQAGGPAFPVEKYATTWSASAHDHFLIPAGTVHCSGANLVVLEISATPYIFTFKLWDWGRLGLDGKPRPIHLDAGIANIVWDRETEMARKELVNINVQVGAGPGWREERTGLHDSQFIESRRHWFTQPVLHDTNGTLNVLNLVQGSAAVVESPSHAFAPFTVHFAETFIIPAAVGRYIIRPLEESPGQELATVKAFVRSSLEREIRLGRY